MDSADEVDEMGETANETGKGGEDVDEVVEMGETASETGKGGEDVDEVGEDTVLLSNSSHR